MGSSAKAMNCGALGILDIYSSMHSYLTSSEVSSEVTQVLSGLIIFFHYCLLLKYAEKGKHLNKLFDRIILIFPFFMRTAYVFKLIL